MPVELLDNRYTKKALQLLEEASYSKSELYAYDRYWDAISTQRTLLDGETRKARETGYAEGHAKGLAEGRTEGLAEGRTEGRAEGRAEGQTDEKLATAKRMKADGMPVDLIAKYTGLTSDEISKL